MPFPGRAAFPPFQAVLDAMDQNVALLDADTNIVAVNAAWKNFARTHGLRCEEAGVGVNYLRVCEQAEDADAAAVANSLRALQRGHADLLTHSYSMTVGHQVHDFSTTLSRVEADDESWILVMHSDVTEIARPSTEPVIPAVERLRIQLDERRRIALELHDSISQYLIAIGLLLLSARRRSDDQIVDKLIVEAEDATAEALREVRATSYLLHAPLIEAGGLVDAIKTLVDGYSRRIGLPINFTSRIEDPDAIVPVEIALFRIAQEALANVHRHAEASQASVLLEYDGAEVALTVEDDGKGLAESGQSPAVHPGLGLKSMRARTEELGGRLELRSTRRGTRLTARIPVNG